MNYYTFTPSLDFSAFLMNAVIGSILRNRSSVKDWLSSTKTISRHFGRRIERDKSTSDKAVRDEIAGVQKEMKTDNDNDTDSSNCDTNVQLPKTFSQEECRIFLAHEKAVEVNWLTLFKFVLLSLSSFF